MSNTNHKTLRGAMAIAHTPLGKSGLPGKFTLFTVASDCVLSNYRIQSAMTLDPYATSAKYYDAFIRPEKPDGLTETELALVQAYVPPVPQNGVKVRALDLGCGTGRHLEGLAKLGYEVIGVDTSEAMLQVAAQKVPTARLVNVDLANIKDEAFVSFAKDVEQVDLITCFWNAWAEIALTDDLADVLLKRLKLLLKLDGKLLINITDTDAKDPSKFNYSVISETDGEKYIHSASV